MDNISKSEKKTIIYEITSRKNQKKKSLIR